MSLLLNCSTYESRYSRMDQVKFEEDSLEKIWSNMVCLRSDHITLIFFKGCHPQTLLVPLLNTLTYILFRYYFEDPSYWSDRWMYKRRSRFVLSVSICSCKHWCGKVSGSRFVRESRNLLLILCICPSWFFGWCVRPCMDWWW